MQKKQLIARKPAYTNGQLLLENDFIDEQQFHAHARYQHSRNLHGFGVVHGLEVSRAGEMAVSVSPGYAVDRRGHEIELRQVETLELHGLTPGALLWVTIGFRTEPGRTGGEGDNRIDCYAYLRLATGVEENDVRLASAQLDERGHLVGAPGREQRDVLRSALAPGSVTSESLSPHLRRDWVTMPFHPSDIPTSDEDARPPFRVGATQALALRDAAGAPNTKGAGGTMAIVLPPGIRRMHQFRVAGAENDKTMTILLVRGGFDPKTMKHLRDIVLTLEIPSGPYFQTVEIPEPHRDLSDRHRTLAVDIRATGYVGVSLIALDVSY